MSRLIIPIIILLVLELYTFFALRTVTKNKYLLIGFWAVSIMVYGIFFYHMINAQDGGGFTRNSTYAFGLLITFLIPKIMILVILFSEDIFRFFSTIYNYLSGINSVKESIPSRRMFISQLALGIAAIPFSGFIYGVFKGRYDFRVINQYIEFDDLPDAFDGFTITQISDIHSGSFDNKEKIEYAVDLINEQKSDVILFTGDIVNGVAEEMNPWIDTFKKLKANQGMYSVLGNHDYGIYGLSSKEELEENHKKIEQVHKKIGFDLLQNEYRTIVKNGEKLHLLGVENWGASRHFPKKGSLKQASDGLAKDEFKILMSHDPSHFDYTKMEKNDEENIRNLDTVLDETNIIDFEKRIQLTLAGHTHGMQFGIEIPWLGLKWSPVKYRYSTLR